MMLPIIAGKGSRMKIRLIACILCLSSIGAAQSVSTKGEALDKVQVLAMVAGDLPSARVASLVVERGITFEPRDRYVELLQKAGADEGVITAVRVASRPSTAADDGASSGNGPLTRDQILDLLQTGVESGVLAQLVARRGIDFEPYDEYLHAYQIAGAQENLLSTLRKASGPNMPEHPATTAPTAHDPERPDVTGGTPNRIRVPGEVQEEKLISKTDPVYPPIAKMARIQGTVRLSALIGLDGSVEDLKAVSGHPMLIASALAAVSKWQYQPTKIKGKPVKVLTEIDVNYRLTF
jgi:TonB family protein